MMDEFSLSYIVNSLVRMKLLLEFKHSCFLNGNAKIRCLELAKFNVN